jgi:hypothetical protein
LRLRQELRFSSCLIDGEAIVCDDNGVAVFQKLRQCRGDRYGNGSARATDPAGRRTGWNPEAPAVKREARRRRSGDEDRTPRLSRYRQRDQKRYNGASVSIAHDAVRNRFRKQLPPPDE